MRISGKGSNVAFFKKHWLFIVAMLVAIAFAVYNPSAIGQLFAGAIALLGILRYLITGGSGSKNGASSGRGVAGASTRTDSGIEGLKRTAESGISGIDTAKNTLDSGSTAIDNALRNARQRATKPEP